jgi:hypothetical protein
MDYSPDGAIDAIPYQAMDPTPDQALDPTLHQVLDPTLDQAKDPHSGSGPGSDSIGLSSDCRMLRKIFKLVKIVVL